MNKEQLAVANALSNNIDYLESIKNTLDSFSEGYTFDFIITSNSTQEFVNSLKLSTNNIDLTEDINTFINAIRNKIEEIYSSSMSDFTENKFLG
jgi:hypothetical protein